VRGGSTPPQRTPLAKGPDPRRLCAGQGASIDVYVGRAPALAINIRRSNMHSSRHITPFQRARKALGSFRRDLDWMSLCITHPFMRPIFIGRMQALVASVLAIPDPRTPKPPPGMRWHRIGLRWSLFEGDALVAYVKCNSGYDNRYVYWNAVYRPDTIEVVAWGSRYEAQCRLVEHLIASCRDARRTAGAS
jgi:hypothetical protein